MLGKGRRRELSPQAETARRLQMDYENRVAAIKASAQRRREEEVRRRQQRHAALDRLQAATKVRTRSATACSCHTL
jgi:hypothetical protein